MDVLIPIGDYPFFVHACCKNVLEYGDGRVIFLVAKNPSSRMLQAFKEHNCVYIETPFEESNHGVHLKILDWTIQNIQLSEWVLVQHCDMFWRSNWMPNSLDGVACMLPYYSEPNEFFYKENKFMYKNTKLIRTHDFAGFYNVCALKELNLKFQWGILSEIASIDLLCSLDHFKWIHRNTLLKKEDFIDGSDLIALELAVRLPGSVKELKDKNYDFYHSWGIFGFAAQMSIDDESIKIDWTYEKCIRGIVNYSWISSFLFDKDIMKDKIFPWFFTKLMFKNLIKSNLCEYLKKYKEPNIQPLEDNPNNIKFVRFKDKEFNCLKIL
jgi:hypothetical protein